MTAQEAARKADGWLKSALGSILDARAEDRETARNLSEAERCIDLARDNLTTILAAHPPAPDHTAALRARCPECHCPMGYHVVEPPHSHHETGLRCWCELPFAAARPADPAEGVGGKADQQGIRSVVGTLIQHVHEYGVPEPGNAYMRFVDEWSERLLRASGFYRLRDATPAPAADEVRGDG